MTEKSAADERSPDAALSLSLIDGEVDPLANRTDRALMVIRRGILTGRLHPGQALVEADIANMLGMSKTPIREALKTLVGTGLVTFTPYRGAIVRVLDVAAAEAVYDMRLVLEPEAVRRGVRAGVDSAKAAEALARAKAAGEAGDMAGMSLANREFHCALYEGCGNPLMIRTLGELKDQTALISVSGWRAERSWRTEAGEHQRILDAAKTGDADAAANQLHGHITDFFARVVRHWAGGGATLDPGAVAEPNEA